MLEPTLAYIINPRNEDDYSGLFVKKDEHIKSPDHLFKKFTQKFPEPEIADQEGFISQAYKMNIFDFDRDNLGFACARIENSYTLKGTQKRRIKRLKLRVIAKLTSFSYPVQIIYTGINAWLMADIIKNCQNNLNNRRISDYEISIKHENEVITSGPLKTIIAKAFLSETPRFKILSFDTRDMIMNGYTWTTKKVHNPFTLKIEGGHNAILPSQR